MPAYYQSDDLSKLADVSQGAPGLWDKFQAWYADVFQDGALSAREKALIALAVANALQCPYCIDVYTKSSLESGSNLDQMTEALHVAAAIRSGATLAHGVQMKAVADKLSM
ncbi:MAG: arsenosugar biosynthesis-associated peroxidase-like protein [Isosphaeraceae bacterium]